MGNNSWNHFLDELATLEQIVDGFGNYRPSRNRRDQVLHDAVGGLMLLLEKLTGQRATAQKGRSDVGKSPKLSSPQAHAIGELLRIVEPRLPETSLVNMILKIRSDHKGRSLDSLKHQMLLGGKRPESGLMSI